MSIGKKCCIALLAIAFGIFSDCAIANNLEVKHVALRAEVVGSHALVEFDVRWENSWRSDLAEAAPFNYDAAWVFVKFSADGGATWQHATLSANNTDHTVLLDNGVPATVQAVPDGKGVLLFRAQAGAGANDWDDVQLRWNYSADGLAALTSSTLINVLGIETVYIPSGSFFLGDPSPAPLNGQFEEGVSGMPFAVTGEDAIILGGGSEGIMGNNNAEGMAHEDDFNDSVSQTLPATFPKGYAAFYLMKYEITQGQYADFLNLLTPAQAARRTISDATDYENFRGSIAGTHPLFAASASDRACNFLSWADAAAYADWAGLRPMTELEYEKACRGDQSAVSGEYAWGSSNINKQTGHSGADGSGAETATPSGANANLDFGINGPVRAGIYAAASGGDREPAGAAFFGAMELSGNLWERVVTVANSAGRIFTGTHGDGELNTSTGLEGDATNSDWPGANALGAGFRGGAWRDLAKRVRTADRSCAASTDDQRINHYGFRGVRTAP